MLIGFALFATFLKTDLSTFVFPGVSAYLILIVVALVLLWVMAVLHMVSAAHAERAAREGD
jgi:uncharacterized membrane protein (DUF485 family)